MRYYYFPNELICRKLFFYGYSCVLLDSEYVLHFVSSLINFRSFSASKFVLCQFFVLKSFRMPGIVFFKRKQIFFKLSFFFHIQKIIFVFKIVHCAVFLLWSIYSGKGEGTLNEFRVNFFFININASNHIISISVRFVQNTNQIFQIPFNFFIAKLLIFQFRLVLKGFKIDSIKKLIHASSSFWISSIFK